MNNKDITISIIGAGPGGYEAAILASKLGAKVNLIEENTIGGVCLNKGCIPTKVFLNTANKIKEIKEISALDIETDTPVFDYSKVVNRKNKNIEKLKNGILSLIENNNINLIKGRAKLVKNNLIEVQTDNEIKTVPTDFTILATGSSPLIPENFNYNGKTIISTDDLFELTQLPDSIIIIGGGIAAIEISQYLARFNVKVTIIEVKDHILPSEDQDIVRKFVRVLKKDKIKILTKTQVISIKEMNNQVEVITSNGKELKADMALICIGRVPNTDQLFEDSLNIKLDNQNLILVDEYLKTGNDSVYAIGDIINSPMLAHTASHEGHRAVFNILGNKEKVSYKSNPNTIFTEPELASVGLKEDYLKRNNIEYKKGTFPFRLLGKSLTLNKQDGLVKILTDKNEKIIGASIFGAHASDLIMELVLAVQLGLTINDLINTTHPHPSLSEAIVEAARDSKGLSINQL